MENTNPQSFDDVKVFVGDNDHEASDVTYKDFSWNNKGKQTKFSQRENLNCLPPYLIIC